MPTEEEIKAAAIAMLHLSQERLASGAGMPSRLDEARVALTAAAEVRAASTVTERKV